MGKNRLLRQAQTAQMRKPRKKAIAFYRGLLVGWPAENVEVLFRDDLEADFRHHMLVYLDIGYVGA